MGTAANAETVSDQHDVRRELGGYKSLVRQNIDNKNVLYLHVTGVHCAGCIQKVESAVYKNKDVDLARLNFSTGRLNIIWDGSPDVADDFVHDIESMGYGVQPFNPESEKNEDSHQDRFLLLCLGVAAFAIGNIMLLSLGLWITTAETMGVATRSFMHWVAAIIAIPTIIFAGRPFFFSALKALRNRHTNMDVPISLALILATGMSVFELLQNGEHVYFDSAVMLTFFLLIGRYLDFRARRSAKRAATDLMQTLSGFATIINGGKHERIPIRDVREGMIVSVSSGEKFPVDGTIHDGTTSVDTSLVTGETVPHNCTAGDAVYAGTLNLSAPIKVLVSKRADDTLLADIVRLMEKAEQGQATYVRLADKAATLYTPFVHSLALIAFLFWLFIGHMAWQDAMMIAVTVLIITCPCALGLAVPVVQVLGSGLLMKHGVLLKSGDALEKLAKIDTVFLDKTGTLTIGKPALVDQSNEDTMQLAASLASHSKHPLSQALVNAYGGGDLLNFTDISETPGYGLEGTYDGQIFRLGQHEWVHTSKPLNNDDKGQTIYFASDDGKIAGSYIFQDDLKHDAAAVIKSMQNSGLKTCLISGDHNAEVERISAQVNITDYHAEMKPDEKYTLLENAKKGGSNVLMVGDGLNDAPVLMAADISMAPGSAIDMAQNAADIVFMGDGLSQVTFTYDVARKTQSLILQNFVLAAIYNMIAIPFAFMGYITPFIAALAMSGSSLIVILNSFRLKFTRNQRT